MNTNQQTTKKKQAGYMENLTEAANAQDAYCYFEHAAGVDGWFDYMASGEAAQKGRAKAKFLGVQLPAVCGRTKAQRKSFYLACSEAVRAWAFARGIDARSGNKIA